MAWRIHEHVLRGEIDNRTRGRVSGRVWLAGVAEPLRLELRGDPEPDLAGCLLRFENPRPLPLTTQPPALVQTGEAGYISAARKVRVLEVPVPEAMAMWKRGESPPEHLANSLYLEWYSECSGRVMIESADYRLEVSEPSWRFTAEEIAERNRQAEEGGSAFAIEVHADGTTKEWDEFRCEQLLRESDMVGEKYRRLLEQYQDHPDRERIIAREMGWTWLEEALEAEAAVTPEEKAAREAELAAEEEAWEEPAPDPALEGIDWVRDDDGDIVHPIFKRAKDALYLLMDDLKAVGRMPGIGDAAMEDLFGELSILHAKLGGALGSLARRIAPDHALVVAQLKRILPIHHRAVAALVALQPGPLIARERLDHLRAELFGIREDMLALIARLRG
ncbi:MAG TPA: hypothetical protein VGO11_24780 [Chthoniobacteraceae bacterium]|jgi:hypothetical protein|nr:hypothetical protein [Chthoniobacteraceae bacterium]